VSIDAEVRAVVEQVLCEHLSRIEALLRSQERLLEQLGTPMNASSEMMTPAEAARWIKIKPETIREWVRRGELRAYRRGKLIRIQRADLEAFLRGAHEAEEAIEARAERVIASLDERRRRRSR